GRQSMPLPSSQGLALSASRPSPHRSARPPPTCPVRWRVCSTSNRRGPRAPLCLPRPQSGKGLDSSSLHRSYVLRRRRDQAASAHPIELGEPLVVVGLHTRERELGLKPMLIRG